MARIGVRTHMLDPPEEEFGVLRRRFGLPPLGAPTSGGYLWDSGDRRNHYRWRQSTRNLGLGHHDRGDPGGVLAGRRICRASRRTDSCGPASQHECCPIIPGGSVAYGYSLLPSFGHSGHSPTIRSIVSECCLGGARHGGRTARSSRIRRRPSGGPERHSFGHGLGHGWPTGRCDGRTEVSIATPPLRLRAGQDDSTTCLGVAPRRRLAAPRDGGRGDPGLRAWSASRNAIINDAHRSQRTNAPRFDNHASWSSAFGSPGFTRDGRDETLKVNVVLSIVPVMSAMGTDFGRESEPDVTLPTLGTLESFWEATELRTPSPIRGWS